MQKTFTPRPALPASVSEAMQSLETLHHTRSDCIMRNYGTLNSAQLIASCDRIHQETLAAHPDQDVTVSINDLFCSVETPLGTRILSAAKIAPNLWHVRCVPGLLS